MNDQHSFTRTVTKHRHESDLHVNIILNYSSISPPYPYRYPLKAIYKNPYTITLLPIKPCYSGYSLLLLIQNPPKDIVSLDSTHSAQVCFVLYMLSYVYLSKKSRVASNTRLKCGIRIPVDDVVRYYRKECKQLKTGRSFTAP